MKEGHAHIKEKNFNYRLVSCEKGDKAYSFVTNNNMLMFLASLLRPK